MYTPDGITWMSMEAWYIYLSANAVVLLFLGWLLAKTDRHALWIMLLFLVPFIHLCAYFLSNGQYDYFELPRFMKQYEEAHTRVMDLGWTAGLILGAMFGLMSRFSQNFISAYFVMLVSMAIASAFGLWIYGVLYLYVMLNGVLYLKTLSTSFARV